MKGFASFSGLLFLLTLTSAQEAELTKQDCQSWPANLTTPRDCCQLPDFKVKSILNTCDPNPKDVYTQQSNKTSKPTAAQLEKATLCFINKTKIIVDGNLNKTNLRSLYNESKSINVTIEATEKCEFDTKVSLHDGLAKLLACVEAYMGENCADFKLIPECEKTEEFYEFCRSNSSDSYVSCSSWPIKLYKPKSCCKKPPQLISADLWNNCTRECQIKELFESQKDKCAEDCVYGDEKWKINGEMNYKRALEMITMNSKDIKKWGKVIESVLDKCKVIVEAFQKKQPNRQPNDAMILECCMRYGLARECVDFNSEIPECYLVKKFVEKCPMTKPKEESFDVTSMSRYNYCKYV